MDGDRVAAQPALGQHDLPSLTEPAGQVNVTEL
jgi:hypothetical protein